MAKYNLRGLPRLDYICSRDELRLPLNYVMIDRGWLVATNGHILMVISGSDAGLNEDELRIAHGKALHWEQWAAMLTKHDVVEFTEECVLAVSGSETTKFPYTKPMGMEGGKFIDWRAVMAPDQLPVTAVDNIAFNPELAYKIFQVVKPMKIHPVSPKFTFSGGNKAIFFNYEEYDVYGLLMPTYRLLDHPAEIAGIYKRLKKRVK